MEYIYQDGQVVTAIVYKVSNNAKLGRYRRLVGTYHFDIKQVRAGRLGAGDIHNCMDCPFSMRAGGGCYTHKGLQRLGLNAMLKRLQRLYRAGRIKTHDPAKIDAFCVSVEDVEITRFGVYGEPVLLRIEDIHKLSKIALKHTGYTHQWTKDEYAPYSAYLMASTHSSMEVAIAQDRGWRAYNVGLIPDAVNCPASKEAGRKSACAVCGLCNGSTGNSAKHIFIEKH